MRQTRPLRTRHSTPVANPPSANLTNLFEIPAILCALAAYLFVTNQVDTA
jgi:hypothetical protein